MSRKKSINSVVIEGTLAEVGNLVYDKEMKNKNNDKLVGAITRADFKKPAFVVDVNGQKIGVSTMPVYKDKVDKETKKIVENERFKAMQKIMDYEVGTRVKINGSISVGSPYMGKNGIIEPVSINMYSMSSTSVGDEDKDYAEGRVSGFIKSIKPETRGEDNDETGRLLVELWMYNDYDDSVVPFTLVVNDEVDEDGNKFTDGFEEVYSEGDNAIINFDIVSKQVGGKKSKSAFGSRESKVTNGFSVTEYAIFGGEEPMDEENDYYIDEDDFKKLFKAHKQKCEEAKKAKNNNDDSSKGKGLGSARKSKAEDVDDDDCPFDD